MASYRVFVRYSPRLVLNVKICPLMLSVCETKRVEDNIIPPYNIIKYILPNKKVKQSRYRPGVAQSVPGS
jgi:hypothetical protein